MFVYRVAATLVAIVELVGCSEPTQPASPRQASYPFLASPTCAVSPTVVVSDEAALTAALSSAAAGDVVGTNGMIAVTADGTVSSSITFTCVTPRSGVLVAPGWPGGRLG